MFLGASLNPDYFSQKVNLFVALGPATKMTNVGNKVFQDLSPEWREIEYLTLKLGAYN